MAGRDQVLRMGEKRCGDVGGRGGFDPLPPERFDLAGEGRGTALVDDEESLDG